MAYNLQSLITILEKVLDPEQKRWIIDHNKPQLQSLLKKAASLQQILEKTSLPKIEISLEAQIRDAAHRAEDIIESRMVDQILYTSLIGWLISWCKCFTFSSPDLQLVMQELDSVMERVVKLVEVERKMKTSSSGSLLMNSSASTSSVVVGIEKDLERLKDRLTGMQRRLDIVPIVGMGGIGKTTMARNLYQDPSITSSFAVLGWTTMSQDYRMEAVLLDLVRCINGKEDVKDGVEWDNLYRSLYGRRYLIVIDDIWSIQAWDNIRMYFPDNNNGSRIVITSRESDVARHACPQSLQFQLKLLSDSMSWTLLRQIVFGEEEGCTDELQGIGRKIARDCNGLPLAISVIGGLLSKVERSKHAWEAIADDVIAAIAESNKQISNILSLSYNHLPNHLKPCFLYMGAFPEDTEVKGSTLREMWLGEGFLKSNVSNKSSEEEAEDCLKALVERNLLMVTQKKPNGKPLSYMIHDLLRDLSIRKADEEKFLHVFKNSTELTLPKLRRASASVASGMEAIYASTEFMSLARTFLCINFSTKDTVRSAISASTLLRVLFIKKAIFRQFPNEILQLVNLRYLAISCDGNLPTGVSRLLNLQTLIVKLRLCNGPSEIWEMLELRHVKFSGAFLTDLSDQKKDFVEKKKLQTISSVELTYDLMSWGFLESIPNIKKLGIYFDDSAVVDLSHLHKLENLKCTSGSSAAASFFLRNLKFPSGVRKLSLVGGVIYKSVLKALCALPELEYLKLRCGFALKEKGAVQAWEAEEGDEFRSLKFLHFDNMNLVRWRADETNFPKLRELVIWDCPELEEIPSGIGEITSLESIVIGGSRNDSAVESARQIQEEQAENGNYSLQLRIY